MAQARRREGVDALAEDHQQRRQRGQRDDAGDDRGDRPGRTHRVQKARREDEQAQHRRGDRQRAEDDRPARGAQRLGDRFAAGPQALHLLAIARQDEQRVVDRQPESEPDREVQREDRQQRDLVDDPQAEERAHDRQQPDEQRQQRGDPAAEDQQRQHEQQRERQHLRARQVLRDTIGDLWHRDRVAADGDAADALQLARDALTGRALVGVAVQVRGDVAGPPVTRHQRAARRARCRRAARLRG